MIHRYSKSAKGSDLAPEKRGIMKPMNLFCSLSLFCVLSLVPAPALLADNNAQPWDEVEEERDAQEEMTNDERAAQEEMSSSLYGRITSIDLDAKVLSLLPTDEVEDKEEEEDDEISPREYHFTSDTPLAGLGSLSEISPGDYVTLDYYAFRDRNRITRIDFDKHGENQNDTTEAKESAPGVLVG